MRTFVRFFLVSALLLASGCQPREPSPTLAIGGRGGELRVLIPAEPRAFDPNAHGDEIAQILAPSLYSTLVTLDADGRLLPDLAESWEVGDGGRTYVFHLRKGAAWHDGRPFGPADVRFTLERLKAHPSLSHEAIRRISGIETPDDRTVVLRLREPWAPFLSILAWGGTFILPRHLAANGTDIPSLASRPVGTGSFRLREWTRGERIVLEASRRFHRAGPFLDRVSYLLAPDSSRAAEQLLRGEADYTVTRIPLDLVPRLERDGRLRIVTSPSASRIFCAFNLRRPPLGDLRVREAINRAIDRGDLVRRGLHGYGAPGLGFYTPTVAWAFNGDAHVPPLDRARARELLAAAGARRELELVVPALSPSDEMGGLLRDQLAEAGLKVRVTVLPVNDWLDRVLRRLDFDLALMAGAHGPDPENLSFRFGSRTATPNLGYANPELDAALAAGAATLDIERRARFYFHAQEILARDLPIAPIAEAVHLSVFGRHVRGLPHAEARGLVPANDFSLVRVR